MNVRIRVGVQKCGCAHDTGREGDTGMEAGEARYRDVWASWLLREKPPPHQLALRETAWLYPLFLILHLLQRKEDESGLPWEEETVERAQK